MNVNNIPICDDINDLQKLYECFSKSGFCYIPIYNINFVNQIYDVVKDYFNEDNHLKKNNPMNKDGIGYIPKNRYSKSANITEIKEQLSYRPNEININEKYNNHFNKYHLFISFIAKQIFNNLLKYLNIPNYYNNSFNTLTILHYKKDNDISNDLHIGIRPHSDWGFITVLWTDNDGLQIKNNDGIWIDVPTIPNHFIINIGDMLEILSSGKLKSTVHQVKVKDEKYSMAFFYEPSLDTIIKPDNITGKYSEISFKDYLDKKINESYMETYN